MVSGIATQQSSPTLFGQPLIVLAGIAGVALTATIGMRPGRRQSWET